MLLSLNVIFLAFIYVVVWTSFVVNPVYYSIVWLYHNPYTFSAITGHVGHFLFGCVLFFFFLSFVILYLKKFFFLCIFIAFKCSLCLTWGWNSKSWDQESEPLPTEPSRCPSCLGLLKKKKHPQTFLHVCPLCTQNSLGYIPKKNFWIIEHAYLWLHSLTPNFPRGYTHSHCSKLLHFIRNETNCIINTHLYLFSKAVSSWARCFLRVSSNLPTLLPNFRLSEFYLIMKCYH